MEINGMIKFIGAAESLSNNFTKRELIVTTDEKYPQNIKLDFVNTRVGVLDSCCEGEKVNVHFNIRGNEWNGKHFVSLQGWKVEKVGPATNKVIKTSAPDFPVKSNKKQMVKITEDFDNPSNESVEDDEPIF